MSVHMGKKTIRNAKLTQADVIGIRARLAAWPPVSSVAAEADRFHVGIETIRRANRGETFRDYGAARVSPAELESKLEEALPPAFHDTVIQDARASAQRFMKDEWPKLKREQQDPLEVWWSDEMVAKRAAEVAAIRASLEPGKEAIPAALLSDPPDEPPPEGAAIPQSATHGNPLDED